MHPHGLQRIIRQKLAERDAALQQHSASVGRARQWRDCDACGGVIAGDEFVIEGIALAGGRQPLRLHVECFYLCDQARSRRPVEPTPQP